uniref:alpha/beta fold hydrolase n=1 Tax=uncultured Altererythrobacter sp. TaxID=500840 RepID=UPI002620C6F7|nr:alpha/beta hydrolase [uncultured Altererythrobacter sp.]
MRANETGLRQPRIVDRLRLAAQKLDGKPPVRPSTAKLLREASYPFSPLTRRIRRQPVISPASDPQLVLVLPGFLAHPITMSYLSRQIERAGHTAKRWGIGLNLGPTPERFEALEQRLALIHAQDGRKVVLLGWSLGGLFARELAKRQPETVAKVITMGSPFSGDPRSNNAWRLYQFVTGHKVDELPIELDLATKPPVETVALWSPRDGVISPRSASGRPGERDRAVALRCTHMGFSYSPDSIEAVSRELNTPLLC